MQFQRRRPVGRRSEEREPLKPRPLIGDIAAQRLWGKGAVVHRAVDVLEGTFAQQRAFIEDPAKLKWALRCADRRR